MLIISNGAFKSGSTWLYLILEEILKLKRIDFNINPNRDWQYSDNPSFLFDDNSLKDALKEYSNKPNVFLSKTHLLEEKSYQILSETKYAVKIIFIKRNIEDALVSHYHHFKTVSGFNHLPFGLYYWSLGRYKAKEIKNFELYHNLYLSDTLMVKYEDLKMDYANQIQRISNYLGFDLSVKEIELIQNNTNIERLKNKSLRGLITQYSSDRKKSTKMFRKGEVGDYINYFSIRQLDDIKKINFNNPSIIFKFAYWMFFKLRRKIYKL